MWRHDIHGTWKKMSEAPQTIVAPMMSSLRKLKKKKEKKKRVKKNLGK